MGGDEGVSVVTQECVGLLAGGTPFLAVGEGPPLMHVLPLQPTHEVPTGIDRRRNWGVSRIPGMSSGGWSGSGCCAEVLGQDCCGGAVAEG